MCVVVGWHHIPQDLFESLQTENKEKLFHQAIHIRIGLKVSAWKIKGNYFNKQQRSPLKICQNNCLIEMFQHTVVIQLSSGGRRRHFAEMYNLHV
jgi:hypothetical protein